MKILALLSILTVGLLAGCASEPAADNGTTGATATTGTGTTVADKGKCAACGGEFPKAELASHDGQMMCKACMAAHNH